MATCQSSTYNYAQSYQLVGEAMFRANVTLALARSSEPHNLLADTSRFIGSYDYVAGMRYLESARGLSFHNQDSDPKVAVFQTIGFAYHSLPPPEAASDRYFAPIYGAITAAVPLEQSNKRNNPAV
ncbi:hypothetical protein PENNAL_c0116G01166 [Penicillium nalgiovense]|uniref:Uncharacterized protein n=1 Tax=Penicillium nalgiovense TaxID=60175 RepID=A0A1V6X5R5_PENNA|nr:hypothetical protein HAV15_011104 [Penicillium sp. str. \